MDVLIVGESMGADSLTEEPDVAVIGASPIDFPIDFGPMMDRWGGGVVIARIEPIDGDTQVYRVVDFSAIPVTFRQSGDAGFVLDSIDGSWFLSFTDSDDGIDVEQGGESPSFSSPALRPLQRFCLSLRYAIL